MKYAVLSCCEWKVYRLPRVELCCLSEEDRLKKEHDLLMDEYYDTMIDDDLDDIHCLDDFFFDEDDDPYWDDYPTDEEEI